MTLLVLDGFDLGDAALRNYNNYHQEWSNATRFGTGLGMRTSGDVPFRVRPTPSATLYVGCALTLATNTQWFMRFYSDTAATQHCYVKFTNTGTVELYRQGNGTPLATGTGTGFTAPNVWSHIQVKCIVDDTTGVLEVRVNGNPTPVVTYTGDTRNGGTSTNIDQIQMSGEGGGDGTTIDDLWICDGLGSVNNTYLGDTRVYVISPNGNGNYSQFVGSDADSTNNYQLVDEVPYVTTDYVGSPTTGNRDSYAMTDLPASVNTVLAVQEVAIVSKSDAGVASIKQMVRVNSTDYETAATTLSTSWTMMRNIREQNPNTSAAWTPSGVNGTEVGVRVG